jgi:hypothetical protein
MDHTLYHASRLLSLERSLNQPVFMPLDKAVGFFADGLDLTFEEGHPPLNDPFYKDDE